MESKNFETLKKDGVLYLENLNSEEQMKTVLAETEQFIETKKPYQVEADEKTNFNLLRKQNKTVINKRIASRDGDEGMVDVWNYDKILSNECKEIIYDYANKISEMISKSFSCEYEIKTYNLYLNKGVQETRGLHADSHFFPSRIKSFLFLTDVKDKSYGPFSYIKETHTGTGLKYHGKYDIFEPLTEDEKNKYTIFDNVSVGDTVIACVSGAHRGIPQEKNKERRVLVISYDPK